MIRKSGLPVFRKDHAPTRNLDLSRVNGSLGLTVYCWPTLRLTSRRIGCIRPGPAYTRLLASVSLVAAIAAATAGCQTTQTATSTDTTGSLPVAAPANRSDASWRSDLDTYGAQYHADPSRIDVALHYAQALRATGQRAQAVAVLERLSMEHPNDKTVLGEYGRALAEAGSYEQALEVLGRAHSPDQPDWRILSAQGAVLDQMGRHEEAQRYYQTALKIVPDEPSVLSNLGLSYALSRDLPNAEATLRRAEDPWSGRSTRATKSGAGRRLAGQVRRSRADRIRRFATGRGSRQRRLFAANAGAPGRCPHSQVEDVGARVYRIELISGTPQLGPLGDNSIRLTVSTSP